MRHRIGEKIEAAALNDSGDAEDCSGIEPGAMRITPFGITRQLGARGVLQLILRLPKFLKPLLAFAQGSAGLAGAEIGSVRHPELSDLAG